MLFTNIFYYYYCSSLLKTSDRSSLTFSWLIWKRLWIFYFALWY